MGIDRGSRRWMQWGRRGSDVDAMTGSSIWTSRASSTTRFYRSALYPPMRQLDRSLARWAHRKYKKLRGHLRRATHWVARISRRDPKLWAHWQMGVRRGSMAGAGELRGSSTVLRGAWGETPWAHSPGCAVPMEAPRGIHAEAEAVPGAAAGDCQ